MEENYTYGLSSEPCSWFEGKLMCWMCMQGNLGYHLSKKDLIDSEIPFAALFLLFIFYFL